MKKLYNVLVILAAMFTVTNIYAQGAYVTWPLSSTTNINPSTPVGNIQASAEVIGAGSPAMAVLLPYTSDGQRLYVPNTGWPAGPVDYNRYIQFDAAPTTGNSFSVQYVSFNYRDNPLSTDFNIINSEVRYSLDGWNTSTLLSTTPLNYLNTATQTFSHSMNVFVTNGQTFSLRIFPYSPNGGITITPSFAIHNTVLIEGTTTESSNSICTDFENGDTGGWTTNNALGSIIQEGDNHYFQTTDQSGASSFFNESEPLTGDWAAFLDGGCGTLCWDVNYLFAGNGNDGSSQPITFTPSIGIAGNGFSATFVTNDLITAGDGWHSYCAPLALLNPGESLPANSEGHWVMVIGTDNDWNSMLSNITKLAFGIDPTSYQAERFGFDNICLTNTGDCGSSSCTDFENGDTGGWTTNNALGSIIQEGDNHYFQTTDQSGASSFYNESEPLIGDWAAFLDGGCGTLCWDVNYLFAGNGNDGSSQPITVTPYIRIYGNGFSAYFLTNDLITAGDGWHSYCAPLALLNPGESLPANSEGHWVIDTGTDNDWNSMLSNITKLAFGIDPTSYQAERFGFDNICLTNTGECGSSSELCDLLGTEAIKTSTDDCNWSLNLLQPADLTGITSIQILCLLPNQFTSGTGLGTNYQDWFISGSNTFTPPNGIVPGGNLIDFFNMSLSYVTSPQVIIVNWLNESGEVVCAKTLELDCEISCTTILSDTLTCNGSDYTYSYSFTNNADYGIS